jgi:hypothetical protein
MKNMLFPTSTCVSRLPFRNVLGGAVVASLIMMAPVAQALTDDFSDFNDTVNPTWTHLSGLLNSTGQTWDASTGEYRLKAPNNGFVSGGATYGFVGSYTGPSIPDSTTSADFVRHTGNGAFGVYGVAARLNGINTFNGLKGYGYVYEPFAASLGGEMVLYRITGASLTDIGSFPVSLSPTNAYTFNLEVIGTQLHGWVQQIGGPVVANQFGTDATYASGFSGVFGYSANPVYAPTDFTIDNFSVVPEPSTMVLASFGILGLSTAWNARRLKRSL